MEDRQVYVGKDAAKECKLNLSTVKTVDLLTELASRSGVEKIAVVSPFRLRRLYGSNYEQIDAKEILIIGDPLI